MRREACEATQVRGEQSPALMDLRMSCLDQRREEVRGAVRLLETADRDAVSRGAATVGALSDLSACAESAALLERRPPPNDPQTRRKLAQLDGELAQLKALIDGAQFKDALPRASALVERARALGYAPSTALALLLRGRAEMEVTDGATAEKTFREAQWEAEAGRDEDLRFRAGLALVAGVARSNGREVDLPRLEGDLRALWRRLGSGEAREAEMLNAFVSAEVTLGQLQTAVEHAQRAVALRRHEPVDQLKLAGGLLELGHAQHALGDDAQAEKTLEDALATAERLLGPDHPSLWGYLISLDAGLSSLGRFEEAEKYARRALALAERSSGPVSISAAKSHNNLGQELRRQLKLDDAIKEYEAAIAVNTQLDGPDSISVARNLVNLCLAENTANKHMDDARKHCERAVAILRMRGGPNSTNLGSALQALAMIEIDLNLRREAMAHLDEAEKVLTAAHEKEHLRTVLAKQGLALLTWKRPAEAVPVLERALAMFADNPMPSDQAYVEFDLAQALWASGGDKKRARALAQTARGRYPTAVLTPNDLKEMDAWLRKH
jgi:tetratricopeptide (TPR) repeat protein